MLPSVLSDLWQNQQSQLTDIGERFGLDWPALWQQLSPTQQQQAQKVLTLSSFVVDALPKEAAFFSTT